MEVHWTRSQRREFQAHLTKWHKKERTWGVFLLKMKASGKELDPKAFDQQEAKQFLESDRAEWTQWIKNGVVRILSPTEARTVPRNKIFAVPLRMVRTNRSEALDKLLSKSRMVAPDT